MARTTQILNKKSKKELIELLENFIDKYPELESLIKIERKEIILKIKKLFSTFWDWNQVRELMFQLELILEGIKDNKKSWNKNLLNEMEICSNIMIKNVDNVFGEDELAIFLEDWFETFGKIFIKTKPSTEEKKEFIQKIYALIDKDDYGLDDSYEKALLGMCRTKEDIELIKDIIKSLESKYPTSKEHYEGFYQELDEKIKVFSFG